MGVALFMGVALKMGVVLFIYKTLYILLSAAKTGLKYLKLVFVQYVQH